MKFTDKLEEMVAFSFIIENKSTGESRRGVTTDSEEDARKVFELYIKEFGETHIITMIQLLPDVIDFQ